MEATNKITVTLPLVGRTPLSIFPPETLSYLASKSNGDFILDAELKQSTGCIQFATTTLKTDVLPRVVKT